MSIKVMTYVWDGFQASGSELLAMLALADWCDDNGGSLFPSIKGVAEKIRVSESQARRIIRKFEEDGFISVVGNVNGGAPGMTRQYRLNVPKLRQLASEKQNETGSTNATPSVDATPSMDARDGWHGCARRVAPMRETGGTHATRTTREPSLTVIEPSVGSRDKRGTRLPADASLPDEWAAFCKTERKDLNPEAVFEKFKDYWTAKPGRQGTKLDWTATWRNWVREERARTTPTARPLSAAENYARQRDAMRMNDERTITGTAVRVAS